MHLQTSMGNSDCHFLLIIILLFSWGSKQANNPQPETESVSHKTVLTRYFFIKKKTCTIVRNVT